MQKQSSLKEIALVFLKLGATSFGGPAAHIALMEDEFVERRKWVSQKEFLSLIALANIIPGPNSTEVAIHLGYTRAGWKGLWTAGMCFILPAFFMVALIAQAYVKYSNLPEVSHFLVGVQVMVLAIVLQALLRFMPSLFEKSLTMSWMSKQTIQNPKNQIAFFIVLFSIFLTIVGIHELIAFALGGFLSWAFLTEKRSWDLGPVFLVFLKIGSLLFGSGYVLLSFLQSELVEKRGWLTQTQILDAFSVGQFTPGPVFTTATFIGFLLQGWPGAITATAGIFLPAFLFVMASIPLRKKIETNVTLQNILHGIVAASVGLLVATLWTLAKSALNTPLAYVLFVAGLGLLYKKIPSYLLILGGGILTLLV